MRKIKASDLIALFEKMHAEHWLYKWGAAQEGCVDCSGAFVYAYKHLGGPAIAHGSNSIFRQSIGAYGTEPKPGYAAFKCRVWADGEDGNSWYGKAPGDIHHIGLVDRSGQYVLNAKGEKYGFCRDQASGYQFFAPLEVVDYEKSGNTWMTETFYARCIGDAVRVRESAGGKIIGHMRQGESVLATDEGDPQWLRISRKEGDGFAARRYLKKEEHAADADGQTVLRDAAGNEITLLGCWKMAKV